MKNIKKLNKLMIMVLVLLVGFVFNPKNAMSTDLYNTYDPNSVLYNPFLQSLVFSANAVGLNLIGVNGVEPQLNMDGARYYLQPSNASGPDAGPFVTFDPYNQTLASAQQSNSNQMQYNQNSQSQTSGTSKQIISPQVNSIDYSVSANADKNIVHNQQTYQVSVNQQSSVIKQPATNQQSNSHIISNSNNALAPITNSISSQIAHSNSSSPIINAANLN